MKHSSYEISFFSTDQIARLKDQWNVLFSGKDMTYHQSFEWYNSPVVNIPENKHILSGYFAVGKNGKLVLIAPLTIVKERFNFVNRKSVFFIGRNSFSDYLNLIYDEFDPDAFAALVSHIKSNYGCVNWHFEFLKEDFELFRHILKLESQGECKITSHQKIEYVTLSLPHDNDTYNKSLSKSTRQQLRTQKNREVKDGLLLDTSIDDVEIDRNECVKLQKTTIAKHCERDKKLVSRMGAVYLWLKRIFYDRFLLKYPTSYPVIDLPTSKLLTIKDRHSGRLASFMNYCIDFEHRQILMMGGGIDECFSRYSPGMKGLKEFIDYWIASGKIDSIDFTRGTESYKYRLGGKGRTIHSISVIFKK